jgi:ATP-dependent Clp protease ATP-binding subunit ClpC
MRGTRERFTRPAGRVVELAGEEAKDLGHGWLGTEHLLLGLLREWEGVGPRALRASGLELGFARRRTVELVGSAGEAGQRVGEPRPTPRARRLLRRAEPEAWRRGAAKAGTAHLLLVLLGDPDGLAYKIVADAGVSPEELSQEVAQMLDEGRNDGVTAEELREEARRLRQAADALNEAVGRDLGRVVLSGLVSALAMGVAVGAGVYVAIRLAREGERPAPGSRRLLLHGPTGGRTFRRRRGAWLRA